jgi:AraC family ethanolamine operon transcriptional activator
VHVARTRDIDEQAALLRGWNQTYDQMSAGSFQGAFLEAKLDRVQLFREVTSNALYQTGVLSAGTVAVGVPLALRGNATFCGRQCDGTQLHVFSGDEAFEFFSPCGLDIAGFVFAAEDFCDVLTAEEHDAMLRALRKPHLRSVPPHGPDRMRQLFADVCDVLAQSPEIALDVIRLSAMTRDIAASVASALAFEMNDGREPLRPSRRSHIVGQARELATQGRDGSALTVEDLCRSLGVSRRALQYCFLETLGIRPSAYLRAVRLNGARRSIKHAATVADAAALWGFWHFGRFARDYKSMFGELPSEAFRRFHGSRSPPTE